MTLKKEKTPKKVKKVQVEEEDGLKLFANSKIESHEILPKENLSNNNNNVNNDSITNVIDAVSFKLNSLSKDELVKAMIKQQPQLLLLLNELQEKVTELKVKISPIKEMITKVKSIHFYY
jgi:hypothetical protein